MKHLLGTIFSSGLIHLWPLLSICGSRMMHVGLSQNKLAQKCIRKWFFHVSCFTFHFLTHKCKSAGGVWSDCKPSLTLRPGCTCCKLRCCSCNMASLCSLCWIGTLVVQRCAKTTKNNLFKKVENWLITCLVWNKGSVSEKIDQTWENKDTARRVTFIPSTANTHTHTHTAWCGVNENAHTRRHFTP